VYFRFPVIETSPAGVGGVFECFLGVEECPVGNGLVVKWNGAGFFRQFLSILWFLIRLIDERPGEHQKGGADMEHSGNRLAGGIRFNPFQAKLPLSS